MVLSRFTTARLRCMLIFSPSPTYLLMLYIAPVETPRHLLKTTVLHHLLNSLALMFAMMFVLNWDYPPFNK
ncbi:hypothetical protein JAAARDRAFT_588112 [Jaapia argillacea MUCL 33604]|uniref:Uncharacterized protein n=1 Tax=Jaapia argillacea MUCL 33604 TaxID=933084 RepID=A0A067PIP2_9AGAM|nr:hypothetical protein JAAARDRAFT_588112 [Jaapia argillacea MUCL 33604]